MNLCDDNRTATIEAAKMAMIKGTNVEDSPEEMKVLNSFLLRCWQMGWLDRYAPPRHFNAMPKVISERLAAGHGSNVPMQPNVPPMPSNTSNALEALDSVNATQSNALDCISRAKAIEALKNDMASLDHIIKGMSANDVRLDAYVSQRNQVNYDIYTINNLPPVQPEQLGTNLAEVGTDCISREQAIDICDHAIDLLKGQFGAGALVAIKESIEELPPAQPELIEKAAYIRGFEQGRTQGMIDAQGGKK